MRKSTPDEIRARFDQVVDRFSNLEAGQLTAVDSSLMLDLVARCASSLHPAAEAVLDIGCGAGNYTLKLMQRLSVRRVTLIDLSLPMLRRARERITAAAAEVEIEAVQGDIRDVELCEERFDIAMAAAVFHHLREEPEWRSVFGKVSRALKPGGSLWIVDMISHEPPALEAEMKARYGEYIVSVTSEATREALFAYIDMEDSPRPLVFQLDLLREAGFRTVDILHKNANFACFAAFR